MHYADTLCVHVSTPTAERLITAVVVVEEGAEGNTAA